MSAASRRGRRSPKRDHLSGARYTRPGPPLLRASSSEKDVESMGYNKASLAGRPRQLHVNFGPEGRDAIPFHVNSGQVFAADPVDLTRSWRVDFN